MMNIPYLLIVGGYLTFLLFVLVTALLTLVRKEAACRNRFSAGVLLFAEILFTIIGPMIGFMRFHEYGPEIPFSKPHVLSVILPVLVSSLSFWLSRFSQGTREPLWRIIFSAGMLQGIVLCFFVTIHFLTFIPLGIIWPFAGFELLSPLMAFVLLSRQLYFYNQADILPEELLPYRKELGFTPLPACIMEMPFTNRMIIYAALLVPLLLAETGVAYAFGQDIDSLIKAFTHSQGFIFSSTSN